ncbi:hypothetical protein [Oceanicola sp. 22II-s10i]|uniref:hypothetical protein n=1 Tax=Oceanicola sp. 22II-s10i TaxID=1317116 RepID=UPI000B520F51|nr:hypothetical protein [Oceanicola sp. 22II-s10i]
MSGLAVIWLVAEGVIFALWAVQMFRVLFRIRRDLAAETGAMFPGPVATLRGFGWFLRRPEYRRDRRVLGGLTLAMMAMIAGSMAVLPAG